MTRTTGKGDCTLSNRLTPTPKSRRPLGAANVTQEPAPDASEDLNRGDSPEPDETWDDTEDLERFYFTMCNRTFVEPNWNKWRLMPETEIWQGIALSLGIEPRIIRHTYSGPNDSRHDFNESPEFCDRLEIAIAHLGDILPRADGRPRGSVSADAECLVRLSQLVAFTRTLKWPVPDGFKTLTAIAVPTTGRPNSQTSSLIASSSNATNSVHGGTNARPLQRFVHQDREIRRVLVEELGLTPEALPKDRTGSPGTRRKVWLRLKDLPDWTPHVFKKAWQRFLTSLKTAK